MDDIMDDCEDGIGFDGLNIGVEFGSTMIRNEKRKQGIRRNI